MSTHIWLHDFQDPSLFLFFLQNLDMYKAVTDDFIIMVRSQISQDLCMYIMTSTATVLKAERLIWPLAPIEVYIFPVPGNVKMKMWRAVDPKVPLMCQKCADLLTYEELQC